MKETIFDIIVQVRPKKIRHQIAKKSRAIVVLNSSKNSQSLSSSVDIEDNNNDQQHYTPEMQWTQADERLFLHVVAKYGCDYSTLNDYFPLRSRKHIIKKYDGLRKTIQKMEEHLSEQRRLQRKAIFESDVLEMTT